MDNIKKQFNNYINENCIFVKQLNGGVTNQTFLIKTEADTYILRLAGEGTNDYINRNNEIKNMMKLQYLNILPKIFYTNIGTGTIISKYINDSKVLEKEDIYNLKHISLVNKLLNTLHKSNVKFENEFNIEVQINEYITLMDKMNYKYPSELQNNILILQNTFNYLKDKFEKILIPCHVDPKLSNFLLKDDKLYLIDWEYSGMADEYFELANFTLTNELNRSEEKLFLKNYIEISKIKFNKEKYILYKIVTDYLWIFWHLIKLEQKQNIEYNNQKWKERLYRALDNIKTWEEMMK